MKVKTIEQFKVLKHIEKVLETDEITVEIVDRRALRVTDKYGDSALFVYKDGEVSITYS